MAFAGGVRGGGSDRKVFDHFLRNLQENDGKDAKNVVEGGGRGVARGSTFSELADGSFASDADMVHISTPLEVKEKESSPNMDDVSQELGAINLSESSDDSDDDSGGYDSPEATDTTLSPEDAALYAKVMEVIKGGGDLKKLRVDHLKAYLRYYGLRLVGLKAVLLSRIQEHLEVKDGRGIDAYPRSSFSIDCTGDVVLGDVVLFQQQVYDKFEIASRSAGGPPLGMRWVAGKVVNESYGAEKQQHTFTIEVRWSTGVRPFYPMRPMLIKGRNLYRLRTKRQPWDNEAERREALAEKHARGQEARGIRAAAKAARVQRRSQGASKPRRDTRPSTRPSENPRAENRQHIPVPSYLQPQDPQNVRDALGSGHPTAPLPNRAEASHHPAQASASQQYYGVSWYQESRTLPGGPTGVLSVPPQSRNSRALDPPAAGPKRPHVPQHADQKWNQETAGNLNRWNVSADHAPQQQSTNWALPGRYPPPAPMPCSTHGCALAGAKLCVSKSCSRCCRMSNRVCPRHH